MIESGMAPVIVPRDDTACEAIKRLAFAQIPSGAIARELQTYMVQVPPKARDRLMACGHVQFVEQRLRLDQFAVLVSDHIYRDDVGLLWEDAEYLSAEGLVW